MLLQSGVPKHDTGRGNNSLRWDPTSAARSAPLGPPCRFSPICTYCSCPALHSGRHERSFARAAFVVFRRKTATTPPPPKPKHVRTTESQNEQWRDANRRRQRQTIRYRGLVPTLSPKSTKHDKQPPSYGLYALVLPVACGSAPPGLAVRCRHPLYTALIPVCSFDNQRRTHPLGVVAMWCLSLQVHASFASHWACRAVTLPHSAYSACLQTSGAF